MRVLVSGSTGLIGSELLPELKRKGWDVVALTRPAMWDPEAGLIHTEKLEGFDAAIHLAGESIASGRWTAAKKERIRKSRVDGTRLLTEALSKLKSPPKVFISASAIGYYGDRGDQVLTEESPPGHSFLAKTCLEWEEASAPLEKKGTRVIYLRTGIVLSEKGGALEKMLLPFKLGIGGKIGPGNQYMSWIDIADLVGLILHALQTDSIHGPMNATAPSPVTNIEFTKTLGKVLHRPTLFPLPSLVAKAVLGEMADELLLASARVQPDVALKSGYVFRYPWLEASLTIRSAGPAPAAPSPQAV